MPPPPPPAPPPPPLIPNNQSSKQLPPTPVAAGDRNALLSQIRKGAQLKRATTNDRSSPIVNGKGSASSAKPCNDGVLSSTMGKKPFSGGPVGLGDLFAQGVPKLKPTNKAFLDGGAYKSQLSPRGSLTKGGQGASFNNAREAVNAQFASRNLSQSVDTKSKKQPMEGEASTNNKCMENAISNIENHTLPVAEQSKNDSGSVNRGPLPPPPPSSNKKPTFNTLPSRKPNVVNSYLHKADVPSEDSTPVINSPVERSCLSSKPLLPDERARSFNKPLLPDERARSFNKPLLPVEGVRSSSKPLSSDERTQLSSKPLPPDERTRSSSKPLLPDERTRSSSKPLLPDERTRSSSKPLPPDERTRSSSKPLPLPKGGAIGNTSPLPMKPPSANLKPKPKSYDDTDIPNNFRQRDGPSKSNEFPQGLKSVQNSSIPSNLNKLQNGPTQPRPPPPRQNKRNPVKPTMAPPPLPPWALGQQCGGGSLNDIRQGNVREPPPPPPGGYLSATLPRPPPPPPRASSQSATMDRKHTAPKAPHLQCGKAESLTQSMVIGGTNFENRFASKYRNLSELPKPDAFSNKSKTYPSKLARAKNASGRKSRKARQPPPPAPPPPPPPLQFA